jgi:hypothetical protein
VDDDGVVAPAVSVAGFAAEAPPPQAVNVSVAKRVTTNKLTNKENRRNTFLLGDFGCVMVNLTDRPTISA